MTAGVSCLYNWISEQFFSSHINDSAIVLKYNSTLWSMIINQFSARTAWRNRDSQQAILIKADSNDRFKLEVTNGVRRRNRTGFTTDGRLSRAEVKRGVNISCRSPHSRRYSMPALNPPSPKQAIGLAIQIGVKGSQRAGNIRRHTVSIQS